MKGESKYAYRLLEKIWKKINSCFNSINCSCHIFNGKTGMALTTAVTIFGVIFLIEGIIRIISYMMEEPEVRAFSGELMMGILLTILGLIILFNKVLFISIIPIMTGIWIIIRSIMKFQFAINLKSASAEKWELMLVSSIIMCVLGVLVIINPFEAIVALTRFIGIIILISEVVDVFESIYFYQE